jgi:hypothetical protein
MGSVAAHSGPVLRARTASGRHVLRGIAFALGGVVLVVFFLAVLERVLYSGDVMPGVKVDGIDIESKDEIEAFNEVSALAARLETEPLRARFGDREVVADASILELRVDELATLRAAREAARSGNPLDQTVGAVLRRFRPDEVPLHISYNHEGLAGILDGWQREAANGGVEGGLQFQGTQVIEIEPRRGTGILRTEAQQLLLDELRSPDRDAVTLPIGPVAPQISRAEVASTAAEARELLSGSHEIDANGARMTVVP